MKVLFYQKLNSQWHSHIDTLRDEFGDVEFIDNMEEADKHLGSADIILGGKFPEPVFEKAEKLKLVIIPFAGVNHLPFDIIRRRGIRVANSHGNARFVAERAVAMILAFYGKIIEYHNHLAVGKWHGFWVGQGLDDTWESIYGKRCGILGAGEIGRYVAELLQPFGVRSTGFKRRNVSSIPEFYDRIVYSMDEAIEESDIVVIALPSTSETRGVIDKKKIEKMKGKLLVNVGRGDIVDEDALYDALKNGTLRGAAIDCWYRYPEEGTEGEPSKHPVHQLSNIVLSPHVAGFTPQAAELNMIHACENIRRYLESGELLFEIDTDRGY